MEKVVPPSIGVLRERGVTLRVNWRFSSYGGLEEVGGNQANSRKTSKGQDWSTGRSVGVLNSWSRLLRAGLASPDSVLPGTLVTRPLLLSPLQF